MNKFDIDKDMDKALINKEDVSCTGVAGCAKSSKVRELHNLNYNSATILTPTNALKEMHEARFGNCGFKLNVSTYASALESIDRNKNKDDYQGILKRNSSLTSEIFILDEIYATEKRLIVAAIKHAKSIGSNVLLLGDSRQSTRHERKSLDDILKTTTHFELDESLRGTEKNRRFINYLYAYTGEHSKISTSDLVKLAEAYGIKVVSELPTYSVDEHYYGYVANPVGRTLSKIVKPTRMIYSGKVTKTTKLDAKGNNKLSKKFLEAAMVTQDKKVMMTSTTGIEVPVGVPANFLTHIVCIGLEIEVPYHVTLCAGDEIDTTWIYTLLSRQTDLDLLTLHIVDRYAIEEPYFRKHSYLEVINEDRKKVKIPVTATISAVTSTKEKLGLPKYLQSMQIEVSGKEFKRLLVLTEQKYLLSSTRYINLDDDVSITQGFRKGTIEEELKTLNVEMFMKEQLGIKKEFDKDADKPKSDMTKTVIGEIGRKASGIFCDPTELNFLNGKFFDIKQCRPLLINQEKAIIECTTLEDLLSNEIDLNEIKSLSDFGDEVLKSVIDFKASYYQVITEYAMFIGYGDLVAYNKNLKVHYWLCKYNNNYYLINSLILAVYEKAKINITKIKPLASRAQSLDEVMLDDLKAEIHYTRQVRFDKSRLNMWGMFASPRYNIDTIVTPKGNEDVIRDIKEKSSLYVLLHDVISTQNMLLYFLATKQPDILDMGTDCIKCDTPNIPEFIFDDIKCPDLVIKSGNNNQIKEVITYAPKTKASLEHKLKLLTDGKAPSRQNTLKVKKLKAAIQNLTN